MVRAASLGCLVLLAVGSVHAQGRYVCRTPGGSTTISDRPCATTGTGQVHFGAVQSRPSPPPPSIGQAPSYLQYMSPRCASLNDALRTAYARGLKSETVATMRRDYMGECGEDEREAMQEFSRARSENYAQRTQARMAERQQAERDKLRNQQCMEGSRILATKKKRTDLSDGEKADLLRFEENFRARCS
jgi:hypothetical protein